MVENVFRYIELLLPQHKCVTLPEFGAFILNKEGHNDMSTLGYDKHYVPSCSVTFNSRLQHDDGVLTSYLQSIKGGSYDKLSNELTQSIRKMRATLLIYKEIDCGTLGKIKLEEGNILFEQNKDYIFPQHYGLAPIGLNTINVLNKEIKHEVKVVSFKKKFTVAAASAAVVLLLTLPSTDITDSVSFNKEQHAGYLKSLVASTNAPSESAEAPIEEIETTAQSLLPMRGKEEVVKETYNKSEKSYFVIVGGETTVDRAEKLVDKFKAEGYNNARILEASERYRVYIASFDDRQEAEQYIDQFRKSNPKYDSAWLLSRKN